jgi:hypothetical protein
VNAPNGKQAGAKAASPTVIIQVKIKLSRESKSFTENALAKSVWG